MAKLFLSYAREDARVAARLARWLEQQGHEVWWDDDIGGGASFSAEIEKALAASDAVLVLWSANSIQSSWVRDEASYGRDKQILIPLSLDGSDAPLGFRQFQTIPLALGRKGPAEAARIGRAIARIAGGSESSETPAHPISEPGKHRSSRLGAIAAAGLLSLAAVAGIAWKAHNGGKGVTIAVSASPTSSDRAMAADYANIAAADLASYLPARFDGATVLAPAQVGDDTDGYRLLIATARHGKGADASLTLSDKDGKGILWSKSWSVPDASAVDLGDRISQAASQASLCLAKARGGPSRIDQPALGLYVNGCAALFDPSISSEQLRALAERLVKLAPDFAPGWAGLSIGRAVRAESLENRTGTPDADAIRSAREAIAIARRLDPHSGLPYLAEWHLVRNDPLRGLALLDKAAEVDPDEPLVYARLSNSLMAVGRMSEAVEAAHRAIELEPLWSFPRQSYINALTYAGQFSRARADIAEARRKWPNNSEIDQAEFDYQYRYGDARLAERLLPTVYSYSDAQLAPYRKVIAARLDPTPAKIDDAIAAVAATTRADPRKRNLYLLTLGLFGRNEDVFRLLADARFQPLLQGDLLFRPEFAGVRADRRFMDVAARLGLVRYWRQSGHWPDFCAAEHLHYDCRAEAAKYG